jgi:excisionase family DNA binding protein
MTESNDDIAKKTSKTPTSNPDASDCQQYQPKPDEKWLMQEEVAEKLHIALDTMRRYVREGKFPYTKVGKRYLIPESAIEEFLQRGLITGPREVKHRPKPQGEHTGREQDRETKNASNKGMQRRKGPGT